MWNAGKVTSTECKGRSRDDYEQHATAETPNARIATERGHKTHEIDTDTKQQQQFAKYECSHVFSAMRASTTIDEASAPQSPIWFRPATRFGTRYGVSHGKSASSHPCYGAGMGAAPSKYSRWCVLLAPGMHEHLHGLHT